MQGGDRHRKTPRRLTAGQPVAADMNKSADNQRRATRDPIHGTAQEELNSFLRHPTILFKAKGLSKPFCVGCKLLEALMSPAVATPKIG